MEDAGMNKSYAMSRDKLVVMQVVADLTAEEYQALDTAVRHNQPIVPPAPGYYKVRRLLGRNGVMLPNYRDAWLWLAQLED